MILKLVCFISGLIATVSSGYVYSHGGHVPYTYQGEYAPAYDNYKPKDYKFEYAVSDPHTGDHKSQWEVKENGVVRGAYSLLEPDGTTRIVEYIADDDGFRAVVKKLGEPIQQHGFVEDHNLRALYEDHSGAYGGQFENYIHGVQAVLPAPEPIQHVAPQPLAIHTEVAQPVAIQSLEPAHYQHQPSYSIEPLNKVAYQGLPDVEIKSVQIQPEANIGYAHIQPEVAYKIPHYEQSQIAHIQPQVARIEAQLAHIQPQVSHVQPQVAHIQPQVAHIQPQIALIQPQVAHIQQEVDVEPQIAHFQPQVAPIQHQEAHIRPIDYAQIAKYAQAQYAQAYEQPIAYADLGHKQFASAQYIAQPELTVEKSYVQAPAAKSYQSSIIHHGSSTPIKVQGSLHHEGRLGYSPQLSEYHYPQPSNLGYAGGYAAAPVSIARPAQVRYEIHGTTGNLADDSSYKNFEENVGVKYNGGSGWHNAPIVAEPYKGINEYQQNGIGQQYTSSY